MNSIPAVTDITHIALVGAGVIGSGWAARCLANGMDVSVTDPDPSSESKLRAAVDAAWPLLEETGMPSGASRDRLVHQFWGPVAANIRSKRSSLKVAVAPYYFDSQSESMIDHAYQDHLDAMRLDAWVAWWEAVLPGVASHSVTGVAGA